MNENYERYLQSNEWKQLRNYVIERDGRRCNICGNYADLCVHHLWYPEQDTPDNLVTLCRRCHSDIHNFFAEVDESMKRGELKEKRENVRKALYDFRESVYRIQDRYVFNRAKELSNEGDIAFFTGDKISHMSRDSGTHDTKLNRYTAALFRYQPYDWFLLNTSVPMNKYASEQILDSKAKCYGGRGFSRYEELRKELFGSKKDKKQFSFYHLKECANKYGKNSVHSSYLEFYSKAIGK